MSLNYEVSYECTHHGPSLPVPTMFTELGSSPEQWKDLKAAEVVAHAEIALSTSKAFGHIIPKYATPYVDSEMIKQCVQRTLEKVESAVFDWKGIRGGDRERILTVLKELGIPVEKA